LEKGRGRMGLREALDSGVETMFRVKKYYLLRVQNFKMGFDAFPDLRKELFPSFKVFGI
jgi:hypothetical protein